MADTMHLINDYVKDDDKYQVKDVGRLHRKAICLGYSRKPINNTILLVHPQIKVCALSLNLIGAQFQSLRPCPPRLVSRLFKMFVWIKK